jgi:hypothetical protein
MKKFKSTLIIILLVFISSCSSFIEMNVTLLEPGGIALRPEINTLALVNRALPTDKDKKKDRLEAVLTMEGINEDKQCRQQMLEALSSTLQQSPRLRGKLTGIDYFGNSSGTTFPPPLGWDTINQICKDNNVDALVALETFDSDCIITHATGNVQVNNEFGIPIPTVTFYATQKIIIKAGFRIYDPQYKTIVDQYTFSYWRTYNSQANSLGEAISALVGRQLAVNQTSYDAGNYYEKHISPSWMNERRHLFKRAGNSPLAVGSRMAIVGSWQDAAENWKETLKTSRSKKDCGRAAYNLALAAEIKGDLVEAKDWISKSYGIYNNREAPYYQNTLNRRYNDLMKLNQQMMLPDSLK